MKSGERFTDIDVDLLKSINERLAKLDILDILREDINALRASLQFSQYQIDDLRKEKHGAERCCRLYLLAKWFKGRTNNLKKRCLDVQC